MFTSNHFYIKNNICLIIVVVVAVAVAAAAVIVAAFEWCSGVEKFKSKGSISSKKSSKIGKKKKKLLVK